MTRTALAVLALAYALASHAAGISDPTRPPGAQAEPGALQLRTKAPRLESVLIAPDRRIAVIDGRPVALGERYGEGRVVRITESEVAIRTASGLQTLKLHPGSEKRSPQPGEKGSK